MSKAINKPAIETTPAVENYLAAIYRLEQEGVHIGTNRMSEELGGIKAPSVTAMVKRLAESGLLVHEPYQGVSLTPAGRSIGLSVIRRHRLLELFLVKELDYPWEEVHEEAHRLEHLATERFIERIAAKLGYPDFDPHGDPIPGADGCLPGRESMPLSESPPGRAMLVFRVLDQSPGSLSFLREKGLMPGRGVSVNARDAGSGSLLLRTEAGELEMAARMASKILVIGNGLGGEKP